MLPPLRQHYYCELQLAIQRSIDEYFGRRALFCPLPSFPHTHAPTHTHIHIQPLLLAWVAAGCLGKSTTPGCCRTATRDMAPPGERDRPSRRATSDDPGRAYPAGDGGDGGDGGEADSETTCLLGNGKRAGARNDGWAGYEDFEGLPWWKRPSVRRTNINYNSHHSPAQRVLRRRETNLGRRSGSSWPRTHSSRSPSAARSSRG